MTRQQLAAIEAANDETYSTYRARQPRPHDAAWMPRLTVGGAR